MLSPLTESEIQRIIANLRNTASTTDYLTSRAVFQLIQNGFTFERDDTSLPAIHIDYLNFDRTEGNIFKVINQLTMRKEVRERRPDVLLYVNGIPLCIMELKNPSDEGATVLSAWEQIHIRYKRDIPSLMKYCALSVVSDGGGFFVGNTFFSIGVLLRMEKSQMRKKPLRD